MIKGCHCKEKLAVSHSLESKGYVWTIKAYISRNLFQGLAGVFPSQFQNDDTFQQLLVFLKNKDQEIVDHSLKMLALTGDGIEKVNKSLANYYHPVLSKLALKGTPCQAKHSLRSIAKISAASSQPFDRVFTVSVFKKSLHVPQNVIVIQIR